MSLTIGVGSTKSAVARFNSTEREPHTKPSKASVARRGRFEIYLHGVANRLIEEAVEYGCSHIVFEDLTHIRENIPKATWQHVWAFRRLFQYVEYKATEHGVGAVQVPPNHTSQRCSTCGCTREDNRDGEHFESA